VKEQSIVAQTRAESEQLQREANEVLLAEKAVVSQLKREMTALENEIELLNETLVALRGELAEGNNTVSGTLPAASPCFC
jgi:predicted RNase H-like nuclease (RuvC/YqgF family)